MALKNLKNVVVIGGGGAGSSIAQELAKKLDETKFSVTLVTARPFHIHLPASARLIVGPVDNLEEKALIPYDRLMTGSKGRVIIGNVIEVRKNADGKSGQVVLEGGKSLEWNILVLATGSNWEGPLAIPRGGKEEASSHIKLWRDRIEKAQHIALVGGGAVGIEMAGEIKDLYPEKKVTIIHKQPLLLNSTYPEKFRSAVAKTTISRGIQLVLNDSVEDIPQGGGGIVAGTKTANGIDIPADLILTTRGWRPNTAYLSNLGSAVLAPSGLVTILPTLQLPSSPHILAAGDIIDYPEQKQLAKLPGHVAVVVANVISLLNDKLPTAKYTGGMEAIAVTNGKYAGNLYLPFFGGISLGNWVVSNMKGKELFVGSTRKALGY